ncbi:hypothetical protein FFLO_02260 [Filobasidium floriforme]|uniref:Mitochondrial fission 1 protein n=1 Tax=Filobasidium floriforme TaxID=5210 RepID=A0A8K0JP61_9TREE|nr:mitochondria fission 1 protein [Filobasidium floriforme]KAG7562272.1 hypothetical protein FFLO_02260 [Filobasidium floriforme]KAH8080120.1 mitochondria fission 1 protein [Filobasidium floriforme]
MPTDLPYAADAQESLAYDELEVLRTQYQKEQEQQHVSTQTKFNYAWGMVKSPKRELQTEGIKLLQEIYQTAPEYRRECSYYIALGYYKLGNYGMARKFNDLLLHVEPSNRQAQSLKGLIDAAETKEGYIGIGLVAGAAAVGGILIAGLLKRRR